MRIGFPGKATALLYWDRSSCGARAVNAIMAGESRVAGTLKRQHRAMSRAVSRVLSKHGDGDGDAMQTRCVPTVALPVASASRVEHRPSLRHGQLTGDVIAGTKRRSTKDMTASCSSRASSMAIDPTGPSLWSQSKLSRQPTRAHASTTRDGDLRSTAVCSTLSQISRVDLCCLLFPPPRAHLPLTRTYLRVPAPER